MAYLFLMMIGVLSLAFQASRQGYTSASQALNYEVTHYTTTTSIDIFFDLARTDRTSMSLSIMYDFYEKQSRIW